MRVLTNNPMVHEQLHSLTAVTLDYRAVSLHELMILVRDFVHAGHRLLTHPLSGSVKPNETCYKSIILSDATQPKLCVDSLLLIEDAIAVSETFAPRDRQLSAGLLEDFQLVDWTLLQSALSSISNIHNT